LLQLGRVVTLDVALTAVGGTRPGDASSLWYQVFKGFITNVNWPKFESRQGSVQCSDLGGILKIQKSEVAYTYAAGTSIETAARAVLDNNGFTGIPLYFPAATGKVLPNDWAPGLQKTVWDQLWSLAQAMGWVCFFRYRGQNPVELTFFEPARSKSSSDMTLSHWWDFDALSISEDEVRNAGYLLYYDTDGVQQLIGPYEDSASLAKYGGAYGIRRPFWIALNEDSPVRSYTDANALITAALSDVADPDAIATVSSRPLVFAEMSTDLYTFTNRDRMFDSNQQFAPFNMTINIAPFKASSSMGVRGVPTAGLGTWRNLAFSYEAVLKPMAEIHATISKDDNSVSMTAKRLNNLAQSYRVKFVKALSTDPPAYAPPDFDDAANDEFGSTTFDELLQVVTYASDITPLLDGELLYIFAYAFDTTSTTDTDQEAAPRSQPILLCIGPSRNLIAFTAAWLQNRIIDNGDGTTGVTQDLHYVCASDKVTYCRFDFGGGEGAWTVVPSQAGIIEGVIGGMNQTGTVYPYDGFQGHVGEPADLVTVDEPAFIDGGGAETSQFYARKIREKDGTVKVDQGSGASAVELQVGVNWDSGSEVPSPYPTGTFFFVTTLPPP